MKTTGRQSRAELLASQPSAGISDVRAEIRARIASRPRHKLVVLDDDPTGTQTVYDIPVLTEWSKESLRREFAGSHACFYILTNSRSLSARDARVLNAEIAANLKAAADGRTFTVVSRCDSTLRGHFPSETDTLTEHLGPFDATILVPYFEAGGRLTVDDVHYVAEGDFLVPVGETAFARDAVFGFQCSNLKAWVSEKTLGRVSAEQVVSISVGELRRADAAQHVSARLLGLQGGQVVIVNACHPRDVEVFALASLFAENSGARLLFRTAAQYVSARLGLEPRPLLAVAELAPSLESGGLILVGSHVPKTTEQLQRLLADVELDAIEMSVPRLLEDTLRKEEISRAVSDVESALRGRRNVVVFTSRALVAGTDAAQSLDIGRRVSEALIAVVQDLQIRPRFLVAKGGITSSDVATRGLGIRRAIVAGQALPGVPVWLSGGESRFPGLSYIIFPGNVGGSGALAELVTNLSHAN